MKKRTITVPKDFRASVDLDFDRANHAQLLEYELSDSDFSYLENAGFFSSLNDLVGSNIDDFEDEVISSRDDIERALELLDSTMRYYKQISILKKIKELFQEALIRGTGVYFFF